MKRLFMAIMLGSLLLPVGVLAHDGDFYRDRDGWRERDHRIARPGDPGYYCHRHRHGSRRRHCHNIYNDPHRVAAERWHPQPWWRR